MALSRLRTFLFLLGCVVVCIPCVNAAWKKIPPGKEPCPDVCTEIYAPICVAGCKTPLTTFGNECFASMYACKNKETLYVLKKGQCGVC